MSVSPAAQPGPPWGSLFSQQQDRVCQHSQVEGRTGPTSPLPSLVPSPHPIYLNCPAWVCSFTVLLLHCFCLLLWLCVKRPSIYLCPTVYLTHFVSVCVSGYFHLSLLSHHCLLGTQVKVPFNGWTEQYWAMIKQCPDPLKHSHTHTLPRARRPSKKPGNLGSHAYVWLALMIAHSSVKCKAAHCTALRRHTDLYSITKAVATSLELVRWPDS